MPVESSMYLQQDAPDIMGGIQKGLQIKQQMSEQKEADRQRDTSRAISGAYTKDPTTGAMTFDTSKIDPSSNVDMSKVQKAQSDYAAAQAAHQEAQHKLNMAHAEEAAPVVLSIKDPDSFQQAVQTLKASGNPAAARLGDEYNPQRVSALQAQATPVLQHFTKQQRDAEMLKAGYKDDGSGNYMMIPGGAAELGNKKTGAEASKAQAEADAAPAKTKAEIAHLNAEATKDTALAGNAGFEKEDKLAQNLDKHLSMGWAGRSGQAGSVQGKINAAEAAEQLISQGKTQQGGLDARQVEELAQSTGRLLGGGATASARVDALVPHTAWGKVQSMKEWLDNKPAGADLQAFTDRMADTVTREKELANNQMRQFQVEGLPAHAALKKKNPTLYNSILASKGITPDMIDANGRYLKPGAAQGGGPKMGAVVNGHVFLGGDPNSQSSWKAQ